MGTNDKSKHSKPNHSYIDCHVHLWELALLEKTWLPPEVLRHTFMASDLSDATRSLPIEGSILIESGTTAADDISLWKLAISDKISAVITYLDITYEDLDVKLDLWQARKKFRGYKSQDVGVKRCDSRVSCYN